MAEIQWPTTAPAKGKGMSDGVFIEMRGLHWKGSETFLRRGALLRSCTTASLKGPIAILEPAVDSLPPRLEVFETLHDKYDMRPLQVHHGVSVLLLDYLLVTSLFLVSDAQEWMVVDRFSGQDLVIPIGNVFDPPKSAPSDISLSTSDLQWRKIMYGEPLFPKRISRESMSSVSSVSSASTEDTGVCMVQTARIGYGRRATSPVPSAWESEDVHNQIFYTPSVATAGPSSPASESIFYPRSRGAAPSHTYLDPSFYAEEEDVPPVPPIPARFSTTSGPSSSRNPEQRHRPSSSHSTTSGGATRRLPNPPLPPVLPLIPRPRSTPPRSAAAMPQHTRTSSNARPEAGSASTPRKPRQLPQPPGQVSASTPSTPLSGGTHGSGSGHARTRSHSQSRSVARQGQIRDQSLMQEKWGHASPSGTHRQPHSPGARALPSPPTSSPRPRKEGEVRGPGMMFDLPPPAYNSINFFTPE
ncbi:hypothetical protein H0H81_007114 [Sphagnurus paluster]|uniref:Uncharacterized protein n=1 Tax=Sphagnurus paluster TaxID=117069 RepID=A0A9P7GRV3_9AGAR|nr:hypothetical protein H0H81_007114 [Sphagnurus paluster]